MALRTTLLIPLKPVTERMVLVTVLVVEGGVGGGGVGPAIPALAVLPLVGSVVLGLMLLAREGAFPPPVAVPAVFPFLGVVRLLAVDAITGGVALAAVLDVVLLPGTTVDAPVDSGRVALVLVVVVVGLALWVLAVSAALPAVFPVVLEAPPVPLVETEEMVEVVPAAAAVVEVVEVVPLVAPLLAAAVRPLLGVLVVGLAAPAREAKGMVECELATCPLPVVVVDAPGPVALLPVVSVEACACWLQLFEVVVLVDKCLALQWNTPATVAVRCAAVVVAGVGVLALLFVLVEVAAPAVAPPPRSPALGRLLGPPTAAAQRVASARCAAAVGGPLAVVVAPPVPFAVPEAEVL